MWESRGKGNKKRSMTLISCSRLGFKVQTTSKANPLIKKLVLQAS